MSDPPVTSRSRNHALAALLLLYCAAVGAVVAEYTFFFSDDFNNLRLARTLPLSKYLLHPIDVHFVPFHRLFFWLLQRLAPLRYEVAVAALLACHALTLVVFARMLDLIRPSRLNPFLVVLYTANIFFAVPLGWLTSGVHRFPFLLFTLLSLYGAMRFAVAGGLVRFLLSVAAGAVALGFYAKALLLPAYLFGLALCLIGHPVIRAPRMLPIAAVEGLVAAGYVLYCQANVGHMPADLPPWRGVYDVTRAMLSIFTHGLLALRFDTQAVPSGWIFLPGLAAAAWTTWRAPRNAVVWSIAAAWFVLNAFLLTLGRGFAFGIWATLVYRYYFEMVFFALIAAKLAVTNIQALGHTPAWATRVAGWLDSRRAPLAAAAYLAAAFFCTVRLLAASQPQEQLNQIFLGNLLRDTARARANFGGDIALIDDWFSPSMRQQNAYNLTTYSDFFAFTADPPRFDEAAGALFAVAADGRLRPLRPDPDPLRVTLAGLKLELPFEVSGLAADTKGCLSTTSFQGGSLTVRFPPIAGKATYLSIEYDNEEPVELSVFAGSPGFWRPLTPEGFALPAGARERIFVAAWPEEAASTRIEAVRLDLHFAAAPACLKTLRVATFTLSEPW